MAFLIKADPGLFSPILMDSGLYDLIFEAVVKKIRPCLDRITPTLLVKTIKGTKVSLVGVKSKVGLPVEVRAIDPIAKKALACIVFPFWGNEIEQGKALGVIKFQIKAAGFEANHCGLEIEVALDALDVDVEEVKKNLGNGNAQRYYKIKK